MLFPQSYQKSKEFNERKYFVSDWQKAIDVLKYDLTIDLDTEQKVLNGIVKLTVGINSDFKSELKPELELNFYDNMNI